MAELPLAQDFPRAEEADWKALVEKALKGAPFASLRSETYDGIVIEPLYGRAAEASVTLSRQPGEAWTVVQRVLDGLTVSSFCAFTRVGSDSWRESTRLSCVGV